MTTNFYAPPAAFRDQYVVLPEDEAHHAFRVLRVQPGDEIIVVDGEGGWHRVRLEHVDRRTVAGTAVETRRGVGEPAYELTVGMALLKNRGRFETLLEKAVEMGVGAVVPLQTERTEKERIKETRAHNILVAAMKQSGRSRLTQLGEPCTVEEILELRAYDLVLICHEQEGPEHALLTVLRRHAGAGRILVLVGPEGGFTDAEVATVRAAGGHAVSLGPRRLRAETAALTAAAAVMLAHP